MEEFVGLIDETQLDLTVWFILNENESSSSPSSSISSIYQEVIQSVEDLTRAYIWNKDKFNLSEPQSTADPHIFTSHAQIDFGDNLDDEWFIVHILFTLSSKFNLIARCLDGDGEFLLIQAANVLPQWAASNDNGAMLNRVFVYEGAVHMIPPATTPAQVTYLPATGAIRDPLDAVRTVVRFKEVTRALDAVQRSIRARTILFDNQFIAKSVFHKATCLVPAKLAMLLKNNSGLIASAINRFCDKDPNDLKLCRSLDTFRAVDMVNYRVLFTKHLYGKLKYAEFKPDVKGHKWPTNTSELVQMLGANKQIDEKQLKERSMLGFKLTCAFEMLSKLIGNATTATSTTSTENANNATKTTTTKSTFNDQSKFDSYIKRLSNLGYFKEYIEHSKNYNELYEKAKASFTQSQQQDNNCEPTSLFHQQQLETSCCFVERLLTPAVVDEDDDYLSKLREEIREQSTECDDNDDWLCVEAPQLDDYLEMYSKGECTSAYDFRIITNAFRNFINQKPSTTAANPTTNTIPTTSKTTTTTATATTQNDIIQTVDFKPIETKGGDSEQLIDLNMDLVEENFKDLLKGESHVDSESDSFYEIDDDLAAGVDDEDEDEDDGGNEKDGRKGEGDDEEEGSEDEVLNEKLKNYMATMDDELAGEKNLSRVNSEIAAKKRNKNKKNEKNGEDKKKKNKEEEENNEDNEDDDELEIDLNLVSNALESYSSQLGLTGPVSNIFKSLGL